MFNMPCIETTFEATKQKLQLKDVINLLFKYYWYGTFIHTLRSVVHCNILLSHKSLLSSIHSLFTEFYFSCYE